MSEEVSPVNKTKRKRIFNKEFFLFFIVKIANIIMTIKHKAIGIYEKLSNKANKFYLALQ